MPNIDRQTLALDYVRRAWAVFPLHHIESGACSCMGRTKGCKPGKHPRTRNGVHDASIDPAKVRSWWRGWPRANIGIAAGAVSSLVVLDVDGDEARRVLNEAMRSMGVALPETWTVRTGNGWHHYFAIPSGLAVPSAHPVNPISLQGDGAYVVGAGSLHLSGWGYSWEHALDDRPLAMAPDWLLGSAWSGAVKRIAPASMFADKPRGRAPLGSAPLSSKRAGAGNGSAPLCFADKQTPIPTCEDRENHADRGVRGWLGDTPESLVESLRLTGSGQTESAMLSLVRGLKLDMGLSIADGMPWVRRWHSANAIHIAHEHEWAVMEEKAMRAWGTMRIPLRSSAVDMAMRRARVEQLPPEAERYAGSPSTQLTIALCAQLQAIAPSTPFVLSSRQLARALGHTQHDSAHAILRTLERAALLECVKRGTQGINGLASTWRYKGTLAPSMNHNAT